MNSETSKVYDTLKEIGSELSMYNKYLHEALLTKFINERLAATLQQYNIELEKNISFLSAKTGMTVLKAITKKAKQADKAIIESYMED